MPRQFALTAVLVLAFGGLFFLQASTLPQTNASAIPSATPTFDMTRIAQPPTVVPPSQADNGAQIYWSMCVDCHGDKGQGLTEEWRASFPQKYQNCWDSGCHGADFPQNSFMISQAGAPPLVGVGRLTRFSNIFEMQQFILSSMPLFPAGSLTADEAWSLTAYIMRMNGNQPNGLELSEINSAALPIHQPVEVPGNGYAGAFFLAAALALAAVGFSVQAGRGIAPTKPNFFHHLHPPSIPMEQSRFRYTLGAGGIAIFLALILLVTGILEMYYYIPTPENAAVSVQTINTLVPYGSLIRGLHYWSAQFLIIVMAVHLLRVVLTGAYAPPRRFNYLLGLGLFVLILLLDFTGYVLRWDEGIRWALVVGTNLLKTIPVVGNGLYRFVIGGDEPNAATVTRFYAWHIFGLTLGVAILVIWHTFRVRRDGGIAIPPPTRRSDKTRITRFTLLHREVLAMLIVGSILLLFAMLVPAPIQQPISTANTLTGDSRAPWFFLWVQQLLKVGDPFLLGVLVPVLVMVVLALLPYLFPNAKYEELGRWFLSGNRISQVLAVALIAAILVLTFLGARSR